MSSETQITWGYDAQQVLETLRTDLVQNVQSARAPASHEVKPQLDLNDPETFRRQVAALPPQIVSRVMVDFRSDERKIKFVRELVSYNLLPMITPQDVAEASSDIRSLVYMLKGYKEQERMAPQEKPPAVAAPVIVAPVLPKIPVPLPEATLGAALDHILSAGPSEVPDVRTPPAV